MIIKRERPPMFARIVQVFPEAEKAGTIFTFGNVIYAPGVGSLPRELMRHEEVHSVRQGTSLESVFYWWDRYLLDAKFRYDEEAPAHIAEFKAWRPGRRGFNRAGFLNMVAERLSGPLYGGIVTKAEAMKLLQEA